MAFEPIELPSAKAAEDTETEMVDLFYLDGDTYQIPKHPPAGVALEYLKVAREEGPDAGAHWLLSEALGEEGYDALANHPTLDPDTLVQLLDAVRDHYLGDKGSGPTKRSRGGRKKSRG